MNTVKDDVKRLLRQAMKAVAEDDDLDRLKPEENQHLHRIAVVGWTTQLMCCINGLTNADVVFLSRGLSKTAAFKMKIGDQEYIIESCSVTLDPPKGVPEGSTLKSVMLDLVSRLKEAIETDDAALHEPFPGDALPEARPLIPVTMVMNLAFSLEDLDVSQVKRVMQGLLDAHAATHGP